MEFDKQLQILPHGIDAVFTIGKPYVSPSDASWSLAQLWISKWNNSRSGIRGAIEVGWIITSPGVSPPHNYGDAEPHLFVAIRSLLYGGLCHVNLAKTDKAAAGSCFCEKNRKRSYKKSCGFTLLKPGHKLDRDVGTDQVFHIGYFAGNNAWWIQYKDAWIGYVDAKAVDNITEADHLEWFGEVGSPSKYPCVQMGNGRYGTDDGSARITAMGFERMESGQSRRVPAAASFKPSDQPPGPVGWNTGHPAPRETAIYSFTYGGPGYCAL